MRTGVQVAASGLVERRVVRVGVDPIVSLLTFLASHAAGNASGWDACCCWYTGPASRVACITVVGAGGDGARGTWLGVIWQCGARRLSDQARRRRQTIGVPLHVRPCVGQAELRHLVMPARVQVAAGGHHGRVVLRVCIDAVVSHLTMPPGNAAGHTSCRDAVTVQITFNDLRDRHSRTAARCTNFALVIPRQSGPCFLSNQS
mmetsp:Transcript_89410/g.231822  ORF Transcript_89410/g.231822 Transcript_89410/m.231822 type:complete len:203 (-) Transcript_89410:106-714(-)